jgi:CRP-like cAMP-binding protein
MTRDRDPLAQLQSMALFQGVERGQLRQFLQDASRPTFRQGVYLYMQGDPAGSFYLLISGQIKLTQVTPEGQQIILRYTVPGEAFGVIAVLSDSVYPASAEAVEESQALAWDHTSIKNLMLRNPNIAINAMRILSYRIREFQDRIRSLSTERVERRIARALLRLASQTGRKTGEGVLIDLPLSRQDLAEMTGTTLYTVSRTLSQWESRGLIKSSREQITICFPHGLVVIAEDLPLPPESDPPSLK